MNTELIEEFKSAISKYPLAQREAMLRWWNKQSLEEAIEALPPEQRREFDVWRRGERARNQG